MTKISSFKVSVRGVRSRGKRRDWTRIWKAVRRHITGKESKLLVKEFAKIVKNWKGKPRFIAKSNKNRGSFVLSVRVAGKEAQKWRWVSRGTKGPYQIRAKNAPTLAFRTNYVPKTKPGGFWGGPGKATGNWRTPIEVTHPGIKPRHFEEEISKTFQPEFRRRIENLIRREVRKNKR